MNIFTYIIDAWNTIRSNKMRSGLSSLGIIIGVNSVIVLMAIGTGTQEKMLENMGSMVSNSITISEADNSNIGKDLPIDDTTIDFIETTFPELKNKITTTNRTNKTISRGTESSSATIQGVSANYFSLSETTIEYGTGFSEDDIAMNNHVALISYGMIEDFFDNTNPIGQMIKVKGKSFTVIGVLEQTDRESMGLGSSTIYIPSSTYQKEIVFTSDYDSLTVYLADEEDNDTWTQILQYTLMRKIGATSANEANFSVSSFASFVETLQSTITMLTYFLGVIGGISLLVGGIGVMNIMLVSVTERTREIGIRKAIGALRKDIIMQFLTESIVITLLGGLIAVLLSYALVYGINGIIETMSSTSNSTGGKGLDIYLEISPNIVLLSVGLTALTGIIFGILPAQKAVKLKPIDALRFE